MPISISERLTESNDSVFLCPQSGHLGESEAKPYRLVKRTKSPTAIITPEKQRGAYAVIQFREWSDEYRIRSRIETTTGSLPPENSGARVSDMLTSRAVRKIAESCAYVASKKQPYTTFLTLTFNDEQRQKLKNIVCTATDKAQKNNAGDLYTPIDFKPETTIQKEVSRFADGMTKLWQRGWKAEFNINGRMMFCADKNGQPLSEGAHSEHDLLYCWVAEAPDNEQGEQNPHIHIMLRWSVKYSLFAAWAKRIESLWGKGFAHLEKIKDGDAAASYMMKAAGYLCKAQGKDDQGEIRGNRYGMSKAARAPDWETIEEKQLHNMAVLIADVNDHIAKAHGDKFSQRENLKAKLDKTERKTKLRHQIGRKLEKVRAEIRAIPAVSSKYQIILKGSAAFNEFMAWARSNGKWKASVCDWLPEKWAGEGWKAGERPDSQFYAEFKKQHYWRRALRKIPFVGWSDNEWNAASDFYENLCSNFIGSDYGNDKWGEWDSIAPKI